MKKWLFTVLIFFPWLINAQYQFERLNHISNIKTEAILYNVDVDFHTAVRPLNLWAKDTLFDHITPEKTEIPGGSGFKNWLKRKLFYEHLIRISGEGYELTIDPVVNLRYGRDFEDNRNIYTSTRGVSIEGKIGKGFSLSSSFLENQARFPTYITNFSNATNAVPGQGYARDFKDGEALDFAMASGEISYTPNNFFTFTLGQGRNFYGEGYRSMMLSDVAFNYPFFRVQTSFWKIKYTNLWAQLYDIRDEVSPDLVYSKKYLSSHYLSLNITPRWNVSLFESIILGDTLQQRGIDVSFFNPVILYRPIEFSVGSRSSNVLLGFGSSYKLKPGLQAYGQLVIDEFTFEEVFGGDGYWANKFAWQLGLKYYNAFGVEGLFTRLEYNAARPYTYAHLIELNNYAHYGQALAHPLGGNFQEGLIHILYQKNRWEGELRFHLGITGLDTNNSNWGADIYRSYVSREMQYNNSIGQGVEANFNYLLARLAWVANPTTGLKVEAGFQWRKMDTSVGPILPGSKMIFLGLRTEFFNRYYDF